MEEIRGFIREAVRSKRILGATALGLLLGAAAGVQAYYNGWLG